MEVMTLLWRNVKWRYSNIFTVVITILQPMLWLLIYSTVAAGTMKNMGIENYTAFIMPGLFVLVSFCACSSSGIMNYLLKRDGSFYRILIAPVGRSSIVIAQMIEACICTFVEIIIMFSVSLSLDVRISCGIGGIILAIIMLFVMAFFMSGLTYAISLWLPNEVIYETVMNAIVLPLFFLSSALFPTDNITGGLKVAINLNPFTHIINAIRKLILNNNLDFRNSLKVIALLVLLSISSFLWAYHSLKKETKL